MNSFIATYESASGQTRTMTIKAADQTTAKKLLRRRGIRATDLKATLNDKPNSKNQASTRINNQKNNRESSNPGLLSINLSAVFEQSPGVKEKAIFANKLATLVDAGVPIVRSLDLMATQQRLPIFKRALMKVSLDVNEGNAMGTAMRKWPKVFDQMKPIEPQAVLDTIKKTLDDGSLWAFPGATTRTGWRLRRWFPNLGWKQIHRIEGW